MTDTAATLHWKSIDSSKDRVAIISINRPEAANSFNDEVMTQITAHLRSVHSAEDARAVIIRGEGKHFSAGADLGWMKASAELSYDENVTDAKALIRMFEALAAIRLPTVAVVHGATFGGAVGLVAACDFAVAVEGSRFCLSEVRLGIMPAVILPYLMRKMLPGQLRRFSLTGRVFSADEALQAGLVQRVVPSGELDATIVNELNELLQAAPSAQRELKGLFDDVHRKNTKQDDYTAEAIARVRTSEDGQAGLKAFFAKSKTPWFHQVDEGWTLND